MARKFLVAIDLGTNELQNAVIQNLPAASEPTGVKGRIYFDSTNNKLKVYNGTSWQNVATSGVVALGTDTTGNYVATIASSGGTITVTGSGSETAAVNIDLPNTTVTAGSYGSATSIPTFTVDAKGRLTAAGTANVATNLSIAGDTGTDTVSLLSDTLTVTGGTGLTSTVTNNQVSIDIDSTVTTNSGSQTLTNKTIGSGTSLSANLNANSNKITNLAAPVDAGDAANKGYVDTAVAGLNWKEAVNLLATSNLSLTGLSSTTIDGHALTAANGYRLLLKGQSTASENGIYDVAVSGGSYTLTRATDADVYTELVGASVFVMEGTTYASTAWVQSNHYLSSFSGQSWTQFSGSGTYTAGNGLSLTGNSFSINTGVTVDLSTSQTLSNKTLTSPTVSGLYLSDSNIVFEGAVNDAYETTVTVTNPTVDRTITLPDATGTVALTSDITSAVNAITTTGVTEGTNLYFTDERAQDAVGTILTDTASVNLTYNDASNQITADVTLATSNSYLSTTSGLAIDTSTLEPKLVTDGFTKKYSASIGNGSNTSYAVTHSLGTRDVQVQVYDNTTYDTVDVDIVRTSTSVVTITFATAPSTNAYRVVVIG